MASLFGFGGGAAEITIDFDTSDPQTGDSRSLISVTNESSKTTADVPIYRGRDDVRGSVKVKSTSGALEHIGIKIELFGRIELSFGSSQKHEFTSLVRELAPPSTLSGTKTYKFEFNNVDKQFESYKGSHGYLRYFVRATITRSYAGTVVKEKDFWVQRTTVAPEINPSIKMEVGIEECLHIEFEYNKSKYHLNDIILGKIYFLLVKIKIKYMELAIIRVESINVGGNTQPERTTMKPTYEIMDGCPVRGEAIPVRLFLSQYKLSPTYKNVYNMFNVRYYLNLVLVDQEDRRYFKQQEIILWRQDIG